MPSNFKDLSAFLSNNGVGHLADPFFEKGVRAENFHRLTERELQCMRVTNTSLVKKLLFIARREGLKRQAAKTHSSKSKQKRSPLHKFETAPASRPTANQCVRNATVYVPPSPLKHKTIADGSKDTFSMWHSESAHDKGHCHGHQAVNCAVCSELNMSMDKVEDKVKAVRREQCPFPSPAAPEPQYPTPTYDYALQFRLLQLSIDVAEMQQGVWEDEVRERSELVSIMQEAFEAIARRQREIVVADEEEQRAEIRQNEATERRQITSDVVTLTSGAVFVSREKNYKELLTKQMLCLSHVEAHERQCVGAEEDAETLMFIEMAAHLYHLTLKENRQRCKELDTLDYRSRCTVCLKRKCSFFKHPWRYWATNHAEVKEGDRKGDGSTGGICRRGSFFKDHVTPGARHVKMLTGRCHGASMLSEYERLETHTNLSSTRRAFNRSLPSTLLSALNDSNTSMRTPEPPKT